MVCTLQGPLFQSLPYLKLCLITFLKTFVSRCTEARVRPPAGIQCCDRRSRRACERERSEKLTRPVPPRKMGPTGQRVGRWHECRLLPRAGPRVGGGAVWGKRNGGPGAAQWAGWWGPT